MSSPTFELENLQKNWMIRAGAGAGKTTELVQRVLQMSVQFKMKNGDYPQLVITTFTRKATQELKERLGKAALELGDRELFLFVNSSSRLQISTIHGVLVRFLNKYATLKHLSPTLTFVSEIDNFRMARKIVKSLVSELEVQSLQENFSFNEIVSLCVDFFEEWLVQENLTPANQQDFDDILKLKIQFWLSELGLVIDEILNECSQEKWCEYFLNLRSLMAQESLGREKLELVLNYFENADKPRFMSKNPPFREELRDKFDKLRKQFEDYSTSGLYSPQRWALHEFLGNEFARFVSRFCEVFYEKKTLLGAITMGDLEGISLKLLKLHPELAEAFSSEWNYWFIDEYQDTSPRQVELLNALIGEKNRFIVGDPQQSIYLFRGARSEVFHEAELKMKSRGAEIGEKRTNYRSQPSLLKFINHLFGRIGNQFSSMRCRDRVLETGFKVDALILKEVESEDSSRPDELEITVRRIQDLLSQGVRPEQICVLARQNKILFELARLCHSLSTPVQLHSSSSYFDQREVQDATALLRFTINPHDDENLVQLLRTPWLKVPDEIIAQISERRGFSIWATASEMKNKESSAIESLKNLLQESKQLGAGWVWQKYLLELGFFDFCKYIDATGVREANLWKFVHRVRAQERSSGLNYLDLIDEATAVVSEQGQDDGQATPVVIPSRVNLMTVHTSKGLQFEHVILIGMGKQGGGNRSPNICFSENSAKFTLLIPSDEGSKEESLLAAQVREEMNQRSKLESERVFYVAVTRAALGLTFVVPKNGRSGSWMDFWPLALEEGHYPEDGFCYEVRNALEFPTKQTILQEHVADIPKPFLEVNETNEISEAGVTTLVKRGGSQNIQSIESSLLSLAKAASGTLIHQIFESLQYKGRDWVKENIETFTDQPQVVLKQIDFLYNLENGLLAVLIEKGMVEFGYSVQTPWGLWSGQIDLWGKDSSENYWIADYKTGSSLYWQKAMDQMRVYGWCLYQLGKIPKSAGINILAIYSASETHKVEKLANYQEVNSWLLEFIRESKS